MLLQPKELSLFLFSQHTGGELEEKENLCLPLNFTLAYNYKFGKTRRQRKSLPRSSGSWPCIEGNTRFTFPRGEKKGSWYYYV
jgi:hypothetical protein